MILFDKYNIYIFFIFYFIFFGGGFKCVLSHVRSMQYPLKAVLQRGKFESQCGELTARLYPLRKSCPGGLTCPRRPHFLSFSPLDRDFGESSPVNR